MKIVFVLAFFVSTILSAFGQCSNFVQDDFDSFEYTTVCPYIVPGTTYQTTPMTSPTYGPNHSGQRHIYLNFVNGYTGPAFNRPYDVCVGATYRISFYHRDAWGGANNTTFNIYDANDVLLVSQNVPWTGATWNHWVSPELTATTAILRLEIVNNQTTGNNDMVVDDMELEICQTIESTSYSACNSPGTQNLYDLFANLPVNGTWSGPSTLNGGYLGTFDPLIHASGQYTYVVNQGGCADPTGYVDVMNVIPIDLGNDTHLCTVPTYVLDAGPGYDYYDWSTGQTTQTITVSTNGTYSVSAGVLGTNLILNGDFQGGTTAASNNFTTQYTVGTGGAWGLLSNPGTYGIGVSPNNFHNNFSSCGDHTSGGGNMLIANGASVANTIVWEQTIPVDPNTDYHFSFWAMNVVNDPNVSSLQLFVNGTAIGPVNTTLPTSCQWVQIADVWNSGGSTSAVLSIRNQNVSQGGNDFAIDDIYFAPYCEVIDDVIVSFGNHVLNVTPDHSICTGSSTNIAATVQNPGSTSFQYTWDNGSTTAQQTVSPTITTTYSVFATGSDGCVSDPVDVTVDVQQVPVPNAGIDQIVCLGDLIGLGGIVSNASNARNWSTDVTNVVPTPTVVFAPNTTSLAPSVTVNQAGDYYFILTETNPICGAVNDTVHVLVSETSHQVIVTDLTCFENNSGQLEVVNIEGVQYSFDDQGTWGASNISSGLAAGQYTVWSQNQYGCLFSSLETIAQPDELLISVSNDTLVCENGTASLVATASIPGCEYHWDFTSDINGTQNYSPTADALLTVFAQDGNGCTSANASIQVTVRSELSGAISPQTTICPGFNTVIGVSSIVGGLPVYDIVWSSGESGTGTSMIITVGPQVTQTYTATITDACESTPLVLTTEVIVAPLPVPSFSALDSSVCEPATFTLQNTTDPNMTQSLLWIVDNDQYYLDQETITTEPLMAGSYPVQLIVTSPDGCIDSTRIENFLIVYPMPTANFSWSPNPVQMFNTEVKFSNQSYLGYTYDWTFENGSIQTSTLKNPTVKFPDGVTGSYEVTLITTTEFGCSDTITQTVIVLPEVILYAPNTFTPDNDEFNQSWRVFIEGIDIYDFELTIFNRWGEMIWESHDPEASWDGTYNGQVVQAGMYSWVIRTRDAINDGKHVWNGSVNVLR